MGNGPNAAGLEAAGQDAAGHLDGPAPSRKRRGEAVSLDQVVVCQQKQQKVYHLQADSRVAADAAGLGQQMSFTGSEFMPDSDEQMLEVQVSEQDGLGDRGASSDEEEAMLLMSLTHAVQKTQ